MFAALLLGISYGFTAGISPGPLLGLTITQTLRRGLRAGSLVAIAPLCTDLPIIALALVLVDVLPRAVFGWLGIAGGLFVLTLAGETIRGALRLGSPGSTTRDADATDEKATVGDSLRRGIVTNALNPQPYLFWGTVGAPVLLLDVRTGSWTAVAAFLAGFYALLVGVKLAVAQIVGRSRGWLRGRAYQRILLGSGALLGALGIALLVESARLLIG